MGSLSMLENILKEAFADQDKWIAQIFKDALDHHQKQSGIVAALAWASGNIGNKLSKTGEVLFDFIDKFEKGTLQEQVEIMQNRLEAERSHSMFLERLLRTLLGKDWDKVTVSEAKTLRMVKKETADAADVAEAVDVAGITGMAGRG